VTAERGTAPALSRCDLRGEQCRPHRRWPVPAL